MVTFAVAATFMALRLFSVMVGPASQVGAVPVASTGVPTPSTSPVLYSNSSNSASTKYWLAEIKRQGGSAYGNASYKIYRNVQEYGAKGTQFLSFDIIRIR